MRVYSLSVLAATLMGMGSFGSAALAQATSPIPEELVGLALACNGSAAWTETVVDDNNTIGKFDDDVETTHQRNGSGRVQFRFTADGGAFKYPINFPRSRDWQRLSNILVRDDLIIGQQRGFLGTKEIMTINRQSGEIELKDGTIAFSGVCEKVTQEPVNRRF